MVKKETKYTYIYRVGAPDSFLWARCRLDFDSYAEAQYFAEALLAHAAAECAERGELCTTTAYVVHQSSQIDAIGLPDTFE